MMVVANDELAMPADPDKAKIPRLELRRPAPKWRPGHQIPLAPSLADASTRIKRALRDIQPMACIVSSTGGDFRE